MLENIYSRRRFLAALPALPAGARALAQAQLKRRVYFGTDTVKDISKGIYQAMFNTVTGELSIPKLVVQTLRPSFLALHPVKNVLYAVNAINVASATVTAFSMNRVSGDLKKINQVGSLGEGPCFVSVHPHGNEAYVANYFGGTMAAFDLSAKDGRLGKASFLANGNTITEETMAAHFHCTTLSPGARFVITCDLGRDHIHVQRVTGASGHLVRNQPKLWNTRAGSGPRHVAFHPNRRWFYCIHELDSTIDIFDWSESGGWATINNYGRNPVSTVETKGTKNAAAEVAVSPDGRFVYASNRGEDTLVVFTVNPANGTLKLLQRIACGGKTPRHFTFATGARWLLVGNQDSASVTVFKRDAKTGMLTGPVHSTSLDSVMYTLVV